MNGEHSLYERIYRRLLRLYPASFQAEFSDEMFGVFASGLRVAEAQGSAAVFAFWMREMLSLLLQSWKERRLERTMWLQTAPAISPIHYMSQYVFSVRRCRIGGLGISALFALCVVVPFYTLGLHLLPVGYAANGAYDPKGYPFFQTDFGGYVRLIGLMVAVFGRFLLPLLALRILISTLMHWHRLKHFQRCGVFISLLVIIGVFAFMFSEPGWTIVRWYLD